MGDQNCLLSRLWGNGSSPVTIDLESGKRTLNSKTLKNSRLQANTFIQAMCGGGPEWDTPSKIIDTVPPWILKGNPVEIANFAHFSVRPRELAEAKGLQADGCQLLYSFGDKEKELSLPLGTLIFTSVQRAEDFETIMQAIRSESDAPKIVFTNDSNVGPETAMRNIFVSSVPDKRSALGDLPLYCTARNKEKWIVPQQVRLYKRSLPPEVSDALGRRKKMREVLKDKVNKNKSLLTLCPYMDNFLTVDWFSKLERHLYRINCHYELTERVSVSMYSPWNVEEKLLELISLKVKYKKKAGQKWYEQWFASYAASVEQLKGEKKYKNLKRAIVNKHFRELRRRARSKIPLPFLVQNQLVNTF